MRSSRWLSVALVAALGPGGVWGALEAGAQPSPGEAAGVIRGQVVDRTAPAHPVVGQPVRLQIVERGTSSERQTRTGPDGRFVFTGLPVGGLRVFLVSTEYQGAAYEGAQRVVLTPSAPARDVPLTVYDAAANRRVLRGTLLFAVVDIVPGALRVTTVEQVENPTDRTVVVAPDDPLRFPLARGALAVTPLDGWRDPHVDEGHITDTRPFAPGVAQLTYAYQTRPAAGRVPLAWLLPFGAARVEILIADAHVAVTAGGLRSAGPVTASGRRYTRWSGGPVAPGGTVALGLAGLPAGGDRWPGVVAVALAVLLAGGLARALRSPAAVPSATRRGEGEVPGGVEGQFPAHI